MSSELASEPSRSSSLVVLGGADGAITTLRSARRLGVRTICVDARADAPGAWEADEFLNVSTTDVYRIAAALAKRDVGAVVSPASDVNVPSQVALSRRLGLTRPVSTQAVRASVDKGFFRATCDQLGLPGPRFVQGRRLGRLVSRASRLSFPVIVKPADLGGGRGITRCADPGELTAEVAVAGRASPTGTVIVEEFLRGTDFGMEAVIEDGSVAMLGLSRRVLAAASMVGGGSAPLPPAGGRGRAQPATVGHDMSPEPAGLLDEVRTMLDRVCHALGYRRGALNADVLLTDNGDVVLLEMGARLGGNGVAELLGMVSGLDVTAAYVRMALGERVDLTPRAARHAASRALTADTAGTLLEIRGLVEAAMVPEVAELVVTAMPGDQVEPYTHCRAKLGFVLAVADDRDRLDRALATVGELVKPEVSDPLAAASVHHSDCVPHSWTNGDRPVGPADLRGSATATGRAGGTDRARWRAGSH